MKFSALRVVLDDHSGFFVLSGLQVNAKLLRLKFHLRSGGISRRFFGRCLFRLLFSTRKKVSSRKMHPNFSCVTEDLKPFFSLSGSPMIKFLVLNSGAFLKNSNDLTVSTVSSGNLFNIFLRRTHVNLLFLGFLLFTSPLPGNRAANQVTESRSVADQKPALGHAFGFIGQKKIISGTDQQTDDNHHPPVFKR